MNSKKIVLIDTKGNSNNIGEIIGHPKKVFREIESILRSDFELSFIITKNYKQITDTNISPEKTFYLDHHVTINASGLKKYLNYIIRLVNIFKVIYLIINNSDSIFWFINMDNLLLYLLPNKIKNKSIINIYNFNFNYQLLAQFRAVFTNVGSLVDKRLKNVHKVPDYFTNIIKQNKISLKKNFKDILIIGTMNYDKDIIGAINLFKTIRDINLYIIGYFYDNQLFKYAKNISTENIYLVNKYLSDELYINYLEKFKYVLIPYKESSYRNRSSGIYFDSLFHDCIPIFPDFLEYDFGIKYKNYSDLKSKIMNRHDYYQNQNLLESNKPFNQDSLIKLIKSIS